MDEVLNYIPKDGDVSTYRVRVSVITKKYARIEEITTGRDAGKIQAQGMLGVYLDADPELAAMGAYYTHEAYMDYIKLRELQKIKDKVTRRLTQLAQKDLVGFQVVIRQAFHELDSWS